MQTLDRPNSPPAPTPPRRGWSTGAAVVAAVLALPLLVLLVVSRWGVVLAIVVACVVGLGLWIWRRGFQFIEIVAFLIHFDGLGRGPISMGRAVAASAMVVIAYKLIVERWRPPAIPTRHWLPVLGITTWAIMSGAWSDVTSAWFIAMGLLALALAYFGVSGLLVDSHEKVMRYLRAYWVGGLFGSGAGILALFLGTRSVGFGGDPNYFGMVQASMIPLTVYYRRRAVTSQQKWMYTIALLAVLGGAAGAGSRSGLIGGGIAIVGTMVTRPGLSPGRRARVGVGAIVLAVLAFGVGFVANPANLQRGFADRGAGRLDFWAVTVDLIQDRPLTGHGFGQLGVKIVPNMSNTPGVESLTETREGVSSHNTWMDILGDLGVVGLALWVTIFVVTILGFLRPRWRQTREISTTMLVMLLPVLSSSMFQPLLNNKSAWSLIGLSAALQVPSWGTRWRGFAPGQALGLPAGSSPVEAIVPAGAAAGGGSAALERPRTEPSASPPEPEPSDWEEPVLARWDVRISRRFRFAILAGGFIGMVVFGAVASALPVRYQATAAVLLPQVEETEGGKGIVFDPTQMQVINTLVRSGAYAQELQEMAGLSLSVPEVRDRVTTERRQFGAYMNLYFTDADQAVVEQARPYLVPALEKLITDARSSAAAQTADELRPVYPGEQRYYTGDLFLPTYSDAAMIAIAPKVSWIAFIGLLTGMAIATGFAMAQQRRPRVNNDDDLFGAIGMRVWAHVGHPGRRYAATRDQYDQVVTVARELVPPDTEPRRIVITSPHPDRDVRALAMGVAAAIASQDVRVVLVDAQVDRPLMTARLGSLLRPGLADVRDGRVELRDVVRKVGRWRFPPAVRKVLRGNTANLRFVGVGRSRDRGPRTVDAAVLDRFGPDVTVVVLAPSLISDIPVGSVLDAADGVVLALVEGRTVTFDAEDGAIQVRTFAQSPYGVVMLDV